MWFLERRDRWRELTSGELLWYHLKAFVHDGISSEKWSPVQSLNSWKKFAEAEGKTYQWERARRIVDLAEHAANSKHTGAELERALLGDNHEPWEWDALCALGDKARAPLHHTQQGLSVLFEQPEQVGSLAVLEVELVEDGHGDIYPDPEHSVFIEFDPDFIEAYEQAWQWAEEDAVEQVWPPWERAAYRKQLDHVDARFRLKHVQIPHYFNPPLEHVQGKSAQGAFYLCLLYAIKPYLRPRDMWSYLRPRKTPSLNRSVAVTATLESVDGKRRLGEVKGLEEKIEAAYKKGLWMVLVAKESEKDAADALEKAKLSTREVSEDYKADPWMFGCTNAKKAAKRAVIERDEDLMILLRMVKEFWIEDYLEAHTRTGWIELDKEMVPNVVEREYAWERVVEHPNDVPQIDPPPPSKRPIKDIFEENNRALLILGKFGAGKTIEMLKIVHYLAEIAEADPDAPIPVYFTLSSWKGESLFNWLVAEMCSDKYKRFPKKIGQRLLKGKRLLLLLDDLDKVEKDWRAACVEEINRFRQEYRAPGLVVCSRDDAYTALLERDVRLKLNGAVRLLLLNLEEVNEYLERHGSRFDALRAMLQEDRKLLFSTEETFSRDLDRESVSDELRQVFENNEYQLSDKVTVEVKEIGSKWIVSDEDEENQQYFTIKRFGDRLNIYDRNLQMLAQSPLMLNVMMLTYGELSRDHPNIEAVFNAEDQQKHIFDKYIERMLKRQGKSLLYEDDKQTITWLSWLASKMIQHSQNMFFIEDLQPSWLSNRRQRWIYTLGFHLIAGLSGGLIVGLISSLILWLTGWSQAYFYFVKFDSSGNPLSFLKGSLFLWLTDGQLVDGPIALLLWGLDGAWNIGIPFFAALSFLTIVRYSDMGKAAFEIHHVEVLRWSSIRFAGCKPQRKDDVIFRTYVLSLIWSTFAASPGLKLGGQLVALTG